MTAEDVLMAAIEQERERRTEELLRSVAHIAAVREWLDDNANNRVAYLQSVARDALDRYHEGSAS